MAKATPRDQTDNPAAAEVDAYLAALPADQRALLESVRQAVKSAAPKAKEMIRYRIPTYHYHGPLVHFAAFKNHCSFVVAGTTVLQRFRRELEAFKISGTTIHFTPEQPLPATLVKKLVKARMQENETRAKGR